MEKIRPKHLVLVRHGESEGDVRRSLINQPPSDELVKHPRDEEQTRTGHYQSLEAGKWITKYVLKQYSLGKFDILKVSPLIRTKQSSKSLNIVGEWEDEPKLIERNRGDIQGMTKEQHQAQYPDSFSQMNKHPFHWSPPNGESLLRVSMRFRQLVNSFMESNLQSAVYMTHRDLIWSAYLPLGITQMENIEKVNTDIIKNGYVAHLTNINPVSLIAESNRFSWIQTYTPSKQNEPEWREL